MEAPGAPAAEMILFERAKVPAVRPGEWEIAGRRAAARLLPYLGDAATGRRFDPLEHRFLARRPDARVIAGPSDPREWAEAVARLPAGPLLVGPGSVAETIHGSFSAAIRGARASGRSAYVLDPPPGVLLQPAPDANGGQPVDALGLPVVALAAWTTDESWESVLAGAAAARVPAGLVLPLYPAWTAEARVLSGILDRAATAGAGFAVGISPAEDGEANRLAVEALAADDSPAADRLFEHLHHRDWPAELAAAEDEMARQCRRCGLERLPPRPRGAGEPPGNSAAAAALEGRAWDVRRQEHLSALYLAAARWIDECGRDLGAIRREGNFRRVFPYDGEVAAAAETALAGRS